VRNGTILHLLGDPGSFLIVSSYLNVQRGNIMVAHVFERPFLQKYFPFRPVVDRQAIAWFEGHVLVHSPNILVFSQQWVHMHVVSQELGAPGISGGLFYVSVDVVVEISDVCRRCQFVRRLVEVVTIDLNGASRGKERRWKK